MVFDIAEMPPAPHALLSAATSNRRDFSSSTASKTVGTADALQGKPVHTTQDNSNINGWKSLFLNNALAIPAPVEGNVETAPGTDPSALPAGYAFRYSLIIVIVLVAGLGVTGRAHSIPPMREADKDRKESLRRQKLLAAQANRDGSR